ncbi:MAG TPA: cytochrome c biogenesis protein CcdA [Candidatus Paceibacterota bacterium]|jgi:cytochrome c-type biogenesis protein|nr:cytochrome c biogenesis protein CcdA [Candidatus Paceibacterota bacterium]
MDNGISLWVAFAAGVVSFISPCVLPIIPGFLAYLSGATLGESRAKRMELFLNSLFFVIGFSLVFAALGVLLNSILRGVAYGVQEWLAWIGGAIIIFFGLYLMEFFHIPFLEREHKLGAAKKFNSRYLTSLVFGMAFAAGWTPCVGVALGAILGLAVSAPGTAFSLLITYSLGLGVPFLIVGLFASQAANFINKYSSVVRYVNIAFGALLVALGVLVFTQNLSYIANWSLLNNVLIGK